MLLLALGGCDCGPLDLDSLTFACESDSDCADGYVCAGADGGLTCVRPVNEDAGSDAGTGGSGEDAGTGGSAGGGEGGGTGGAGGSAGGGEGGGTGGGSPRTLVLDPPLFTEPDGGSARCFSATIAANEGLPALVTLSHNANPGALSFYESLDCTGSATSTLTQTPGTPGRAFSIGATPTLPTGSYTVTATATGHLDATLTIEWGLAPRTLHWADLDNTRRTSFCDDLTLEIRREGVADTQTGPVQVALSSPDGGAGFFSGTGCQFPAASVTVPQGASSVALSYKPFTAGTIQLHAETSFASATQTVTGVRAMVRRLSCNLGAGQTSRSCSFGSNSLASLNDSFVLVQATSSLGDAGTLPAAAVRCVLTTTSLVACTRLDASQEATVALQVVEAAGLTVRRLMPSNCAGGTVTIAPAFETGDVYGVLKSTNGNEEELNGNYLNVAAPLSSSQLQVAPATCTNPRLELLGLPAVTSHFVDGGFPLNVSTVTVSDLPPTTSSTTVVLAQAGTTSGLARDVRAAMVRAEVVEGTSVMLRRALGTTGGLASMNVLFFQRLDLGPQAHVQQLTFALDAGELQGTLAVQPTDLSRTIVFASSQTFNGQSGGESTNATEDTGEAQFIFTLDAGVLTAQRSAAQSEARVTAYVVELPPGCATSPGLLVPLVLLLWRRRRR